LSGLAIALEVKYMLPEEKEAIEFFEMLGLAVQVIPVGTAKTPEFRATGDRRHYVVEVKARHDSEEWHRAMTQGQVAYQERSLGYGRWVEDVSRNALKQLVTHDADHRGWWVLWLALRCQAASRTMLDEAIGSLFGVRQVVYGEAGSQAGTMQNCLFARQGVFERHNEIVASVVSTGSGLAFCVNEFAPDYECFRNSEMYRSFARRHPPTSATDLVENRGFVKIADRSIDRRDDRALAAYLEQAYGLENALMIDMKNHSASMTVPRRIHPRKGGARKEC
jgi:hypothetical protein